MKLSVSGRHVHLSYNDAFTLFNHAPTILRPLYQPGHWAANETVLLGNLRLRVLGPCRAETQVEISNTDARKLGLVVPVRRSGDLYDTPGGWLVGTCGAVRIPKGIIRAERHVHMSPDDAVEYGVCAGDRLNLYAHSDESRLAVTVRVSVGAKLEVHLDTDEGNAIDWTQGYQLV